MKSISAIIMVASVASTAAAQTYRLVDLGTITGESHAVFVPDAGRVVGSSTKVSAHFVGAELGTGPAGIGGVPGYSEGAVFAVDADDNALGVSYSLGGLVTQAFRNDGTSAAALGGFTPRVLRPAEEQELLPLGYGITNLVQRASATADELTKEELAAGGKRLAAKVEEYTPRVLAVLGVGAYRSAFGKPRAAVGLQAEQIGQTFIWILPNPSGLNAHYTLDALGEVFGELRIAAQELKGPGPQAQGEV